uniref:Integrase, catalytic region, zinc finger, CCHC-type, peptidase aspartic, catalytic n=1 Tax=Tanacetum cinerariifolium TaxID=118510 RepID=A0A6L2KPU5_TANCI|nr:hypothetical protein [Tanacetum cinerariifolium]
MHNNIMAAGSRDHPSMLAPGRYSQWRSWFLHYVDTRPNGEALRKYILSGPYNPTTVLVQAIDATDDSPVVPKHTTVETPMNMSPENKAHFLAEKEVIHLILTRIRDDIYSTVDACQTIQEMWEAIERLQQVQPEWSTFVTIVKQQHKLDEVSYHKLFDILKQHQNEVNELHTERLARNANPLALVATTQADRDQYYQTSRKLKKVKDSAYHKEKMLLWKQAKQGVPLQAEQYDWLADTDEEVNEQELEAHYSYMAKIQEVPTTDSGTNSETVEQVQNDAGYDVFANDLQHSEQSEYVSNTCLVETDDSNVIPDSPDMCEDDIQNEQNDVESYDEQTSKSLGESISVRDSCLVALQTKQAEFEKYKAFNDRTIDYDKLERKLNEAVGQLAQKDTEIREGLKTKAYELSVVKDKHDELMKQSLLTKSHYEGLVKQQTKEMLANLKYVESFKKEIDELESDKAEFSDMYDVILQECVSNDVKCSYLQSLSDLDALAELQCMYLYKVKECECLAQKLLKQTESVSKKVHTELLQRFAKVETHSISLEIVLQKCKEQTMSVPKTNVSKGLLKPVTVQTLPQIARQAVSNTNVLKQGMYRIDNKTAHTRAPQFPQTVRNTNLRVSTSIGVNHKTNVSMPQLKRNQSREKVLPNNSQVKVKKTQVEVHPRIPSVSNKMNSVTACKDSLNSKTLNANAVCATCNKCLVESNHFACVTKMLNDVHARTKKPNVVLISTRKPKSQANKSVATHHKKQVASNSINHKPQSYFRVLYENTSKAWKWWIERQSPSRYKWVPKLKKQWVLKAKLK